MDDEKNLPEEEDTQKDKYLTFSLADEIYGIDIAVLLKQLYHNTLKFASQLSSVKPSVARMAWQNNLHRKKVRDFKKYNRAKTIR